MAGVFSVSQVNQYIRTLFLRDYSLKDLTIRGEVSNCKYHAAGHVYFTLKDASSSISCVLFRADRENLSFRLTDGMEIDASGQVAVYEKTGSYQLYVKKAVLSGSGALYERFLRLRAELEERGWFDAGYKKPIPPYPMRIGVVTSETGAVIRDIVNVTSRRNPHAEVFLMPSLVQGEQAAGNLADAIRRLDAMGMDVMIVGRGGGSIEDLWPFNEEIVAEAIFDCTTPVISAVGHETDFTIADFVADLRAPTPSAAAELANFDYAAFCEQLSLLESSLSTVLEHKLAENRQRQEMLQAKLGSLQPEKVLARLKETANEREKQLHLLMDARLEKDRKEKRRLSDALEMRMQGVSRLTAERFRSLAGKLDVLSPLKRISGGFGYLTKDGKAIRSIRDTAVGDRLKVYLSDGTLQAEVTETKGEGIG